MKHNYLFFTKQLKIFNLKILLEMKYNIFAKKNVALQNYNKKEASSRTRRNFN